MCYGFSSTRCIMPMSTGMYRREHLCPKKARAKLARKQNEIRLELTGPTRGEAMAGSRNISVSEASRPVLPRHAKLKFDETRQVWVILAPERGRGPDRVARLEKGGSTAETFGIPLAVLAELTHRCPLQCPYCSNPVELDRGGSELTTEEWKKVLSGLAGIGGMQIHF